MMVYTHWRQRTGMLRTSMPVATIVYALSLAGNWAACGSVYNSVWIPDPYAIFEISRSDVPQYECRYDEHGCLLPYSDVWTSMGYIDWLPTVPASHTTQLALGVTGTVELCMTWNFGTQHNYEAYDYAFTAHSPVPEPSSLIALGALMAPLLAFRQRKA